MVLFPRLKKPQNCPAGPVWRKMSRHDGGGLFGYNTGNINMTLVGNVFEKYYAHSTQNTSYVYFKKK